MATATIGNVRDSSVQFQGNGHPPKRSESYRAFSAFDRKSVKIAKSTLGFSFITK